MIGDLLLTWMSETGTGTISGFRSRAAWLTRTENLELRDKATDWWLNDISSLGHCEVDWKNDRWSIAPPTITQLPLADGLAVLAGARRPLLLRAIDNLEVYVERARRITPDHNIPPPETILIPYEHVWDLHDAAKAIGAAHSSCAPSVIANILNVPVPMTPTSAPAFDSPFERLARIKPRHWVPTSPKQHSAAEGLYREHYRGRWHYLLRRNSGWYATDLRLGVFAELERQNESVVRWHPDGHGRSGIGTVLIYDHAPLPTLHARALSLCCGFVPRHSSQKDSMLYDNVPREIARKIATSLGQKLQVIQ